MKMRQGFVSNSSSSSFIIVGFKPTKDQIKKVSSEDEKGLGRGVLYYNEEEDLLGYSWSASEGDTGTIELYRIAEAGEKLKELFGDKVDVEIHFGIDFNG